MARSKRSDDSASTLTNFRRYDLNVLPFLRALLATNSVARSSEILGVSQSAVSGALRRLRDTFGDPLFVQVGRGLVPTPKALQLQELVDDSFKALSCLFEEREFSAEDEERCFVICTSDYIATELATPLLKLMRSESPNSALRFVEMSKAELREVEMGNIDIQVSPKTRKNPSDELISKTLHQDEQVLLVARHIKLPESGMDLDTYLSMEHASFFVSGADSLEKLTLDSLGLARKTIAFVPEHGQLPRLVRDLGCVAIVPRSAAIRYSQEFDLQISPLPFEIKPYHQSLYWSPILNHDPAHKWFRELIIRAWEARDSQYSLIPQIG